MYHRVEFIINKKLTDLFKRSLYFIMEHRGKTFVPTLVSIDCKIIENIVKLLQIFFIFIYSLWFSSRKSANNNIPMKKNAYNKQEQVQNHKMLKSFIFLYWKSTAYNEIYLIHT